MTDKILQPTGELIQEYVRSKWQRVGPLQTSHMREQELGPALRSRIDVLGTDSMQLLSVAPGAVMDKLDELEQQAALEDSGMLEKATRSADETTVRKIGRHFWASKGRK
jgi:hypothetical protein